MLLDRYCQLLTAYVDGELSSRQRRHVLRLLRRSAEARQLLKQLQADARALRHLASPPLTADLTSPVLGLIAERDLAPRQPRRTDKAASIAWFGPLASLATAAAVLLTIGVASYLYFVASLGQPATTGIAQTQPKCCGSTPSSGDREPTIEHKKDEILTDTRKTPPPKIDLPTAVESPKVVQTNNEETKPRSTDKPSPSTSKESALADRVETYHLERVPELLLVVVKLSELDRLSTRQPLITALSKDNAFRLELPCSNGTKAFDRVRNAARTLRLSFLIDKQAQERLKLKWKVSYALYLENITPEELAEFMRQISLEDRKSAAGKPADVQFDRLVLTRINATHRKELSTLLGIDPLSNAPNATGPLGADPHSSLSDATARQVGEALAGQGGTPRPEAGKPNPQPLEHLAIVLPYNPPRPSPGSEEIKHFLESRRPARPGTIRVFLVLRNG